MSKGTTPSTEGAEILSSGPVRFIKGENIQGGKITDSPIWYIDAHTDKLLSRSRLAEGDVLFVIAGTIGKVAVVEASHLPANTSQAVAFIRPNDYVVPRYLSMWLQSARVIELTSLKAVQTAQPNLSMADLGNFIIPVPPLAEQYEIMNLLRAESVAISEKILATEREIALTREYRTRLIADVVTGKLDVCDVELPEVKDDEAVDLLGESDEEEAEAEDTQEDETVEA